MLYKEMTIQFEEGLVSKQAAKFVAVANQFESQILVEVGNKKINAKSIMGVLSLALVTGDTFTIIANGKDEREAVDAMEAFAETGEMKEV